MNEVKKETPVQTNVNSEGLPLPHKKEKRLVQAEVDLELFTAVEKELKKQGLKIRDVTEWGLGQWLLKVNPEAAKRVKSLHK